MLSRIIRLYRAEIELFWKWRLGRWALIKRASIALLAGVLAISLTAWLAPGLFTIEQVGGGLLAVVFISALNLLIRPILVGLLARHTLVGLVIVTILFQALAIWLRPSPSSSILPNGRWTSHLSSARPWSISSCDAGGKESWAWSSVPPSATRKLERPATVPQSSP